MTKNDFIWGVASASYQIEGAACEDGRGASIWDTFSHIRGNIKNNDNGDVACDSYHRFEEDLDIIASLGVKNYRFSVAWPRIIPNGTGEVNMAGLEYYDKVVNGCLERGITPWITLFHWDLPQALQDRYGGWQSPQIANDFAAYCLTVVRHFVDRVKYYYIMNEPQCFVTLGYRRGEFAPGLRLSDADYFKCWHNMLLAHGKACAAIRSEFSDVKLGVATTGAAFYPVDDSTENIAAAEYKCFNLDEDTWEYNHPMYLDPICFGRYPDCTKSPIASEVLNVSDEDMKIIFQKPDFIGINCYNGIMAKMDENGTAIRIREPAGFPRTACKWPISPNILKYFPQFLHKRYGIPMYVSENGMSNNDFIFSDGKVHDPQRIEYLSLYLNALKQSIAAGADIRGYFQWSILDNFEWASGYDERFGLVYVDYATGERTLKDSAYWYAEKIKSDF